MRSPRFSVSLMCVDLARAGEHVATLDGLADAFHLDIMDGHFAPNLALSPAWVRSIRPYTSRPLEAHLMTERPLEWVEPLVGAGVSTLSPHAETLSRDAFRVMDVIREHGCRTGVVLNPLTPLDAVKHLLPRVDLVTLMTVDVGFASQPFVAEVIPKLAEAAEFRQREGLTFDIQIDGACNESTYHSLWDAGADMFVLGSTGLFNLDQDLTVAWGSMEAAFARATGASLRGAHV